jgi:hypothetical protein
MRFVLDDFGLVGTTSASRFIMPPSRRRFAITIQDIREALVTSGYSTLDEQAKALGVHRATAWTIIKNKHKLGRLSAKTTSRILKNPETPPLVRAVVLEYLSERTESPV